jgi:hypothetical protein
MEPTKTEEQLFPGVTDGDRSIQSSDFEDELRDPAAGYVLDVVEPGGPLLVVFGGLSGEMTMPPFEFFKTCEVLQVNKLFLRDHAQAWYHRGCVGLGGSLSEIADALRRQVNDLAPSRLVVLGNSAGGFAAIYFGTLLGAHRIIAFSPQTFIDRWTRRRYGDRRWAREIGAMRNDPPLERVYDLRQPLKRSARTTQIDLYYARDLHLDSIHCTRLKAFPNVKGVPIEGDSHTVARTLKESGRLQQIVADSLAVS